jgi:dUTPase
VSFKAVHKADLCDGDAAKGYVIYFSPVPQEQEFPTVWLDLHIGGETYQRSEDDLHRRGFRRPDDSGRKWVRIGPRECIRLQTAESVGIDSAHTAVVTNVAGRAKHGLIVAPGKVDPGFNPAPLVLVVFNQSGRACALHVGDKIAAIAFAEVTEKCVPTTSRGHAQGGLPDFELSRRQRLAMWSASLPYGKIAGEILKLVIAALLALLVAYLVYRFGLRALPSAVEGLV